MTKQPKLSKAEAIKEIEKLTGLDYINGNLNDGIWSYAEFEKNRTNPNHLNIFITNFSIKATRLDEDLTPDYGKLPIKWLEPLSRLIPILFEKEGE